MIEHRLPGSIDPDDLEGIVDVTHDSRSVTPGSLFACVVGERFDGHDFAAQAVDRGAIALLVERRLDLDVEQFVVPNVRAAMGLVAAHVHRWPSDSLSLIGVTGTNGKTTVTHMLTSLLNRVGRATTQLGTLSGARTTPESPELQRHLATRLAAGDEAVAMEVSSHALVQHRVAGCRFAAGVFTNLGRDHLDLHGTMEEYFRAKASLFTPELTQVAVVNRDDTYGRLLVDALDIAVQPYSIGDLDDVKIGVDQLEFVWRGQHTRVPIGGGFNLPNALAALETAVVLGADIDQAAAGMSEISAVPGRFEVIEADVGFSVVVDYAHTPDGLVEVLAAARRLDEVNRVIVVFGCGGDRDRDKRPLMGAAAADGADVLVVTSDNPRHEEPGAIIDDIMTGLDRSVTAHVEPDRRAAIGLALDLARNGDIVVIAGKGHETTQMIGDTALDFDDREVARQLLENLQ